MVAEEPWGGSRRVRRVPKLVCMALEEQGAGAEFYSCREVTAPQQRGRSTLGFAGRSGHAVLTPHQLCSPCSAAAHPAQGWALRLCFVTLLSPAEAKSISNPRQGAQGNLLAWATHRSAPNTAV